MSRLVVIGREQFSPVHLKVFREEELRAIFGEVAEEVARIAGQTIALFPPLAVKVEVCGRQVHLPQGLSFASGVELNIPDGLYVPALLDGEFLEFLLFDLPRKLDEARRAVVVEDLDQRFTRDVEEGVLYSLDILSRVSAVYRVPVLVHGSRHVEELWGFAKSIVCVEGERCYLDGEPFCGERYAQP